MMESINPLSSPRGDVSNPLSSPKGVVSPKGSFTINPFYFNQRHFLLENLVEKTHIPSLWKSKDENILWGIKEQFIWQHLSGRLRETESRTKEIHHQSWWSGMNYYLSVLPCLAASQVGILPRIKLRDIKHPNRGKFITDLSGCLPDQVNPNPQLASAILSWVKFFTELLTIQKIPKEQMSTYQAKQMDKHLLRLMWEAHTESIRYANPLFEEELKLLSGPEQGFAYGWSQTVEFLALILLRTDLDGTEAKKYLPHRSLASTDGVNIRDMSFLQNGVIKACQFVVKVSSVFPVFGVTRVLQILVDAATKAKL